jgi:thiol-disulfide isomerase/thioredoxin
MPGDSSKAWRQQGIAAATRGDRAAAQAALIAALTANAADAEAWFWLAGIQSDPRLAAQALDHVLALQPDHARARAALAALRSGQAPVPAIPPEPAIQAVHPPSADEPWEEWAPPRYQSWAETHGAPAATASNGPPGPDRGPSAARIRAATAQSLPPPLAEPAREGVGVAVAGGMGVVLRVLVPVIAILLVFQMWNDQTSAAVGRAAPDLQVADAFSGQAVSLSSLRGHPVWLNFWATWCAPCRDELPAMQQRYTQGQAAGLVILGVDSTEPAATVRQFVATGSFGWSFGLDPGAASRLYHVGAIPQHVFIDRAGVIRATHTGGIPPSEMDADLALIMGH